MAKGLDIRRRIKSIKNTKAITKAMQMVAASKMRKAQEAALKSRAYADKALEILAGVSESQEGIEHFLLQKTEGKRFLVLLVTPNKGLCGSLTTNLLRQMTTFIQEEESAGESASFEFVVIGKKGRDALLRMNKTIKADFSTLGETFGVNEMVPITKLIFESFQNREYDAVYAMYTHFYSVINQKPVIKRILPLGKDLLSLLEMTNKEYEKVTETKPFSYLLEPNPVEVLKELLPRLTETQVYQSALEAQASEQSARMVAMKNATEAAGDLMDDLTLQYNKTRQAAITQEISEIVGGVEAMKG